MEFTTANGGMKIDFPKDYNTGTTVNADATGKTMLTTEAGKKVKIKVHGAKDGTEVLIDYLFEKDGLGTKKYFV